MEICIGHVSLLGNLASTDSARSVDDPRHRPNQAVERDLTVRLCGASRVGAKEEKGIGPAVDAYRHLPGQGDMRLGWLAAKRGPSTKRL